MTKIRRIQWTILILVFLSGGLAACDVGGDEVVVPTRFVPPTEVAASGQSAAPTLTDVAAPGDTAVPQPNAPTLPPTYTFTPTSTLIPTITMTPSMTITDTPTRTPTLTPSPTSDDSSLLALAQLAAQATIAPTLIIPTAPPVYAPTTGPLAFTPTTAPGLLATPLPATQCQFLPPGGFGGVIINQPDLVNVIGCPVGAPPLTASYSGAVQMFQGGIMVWIGETPAAVYAFYSDGTFHRFDDLFDPAIDPESGGETPPDGLLEPVRGFGKVWRSFETVRTNLGWALSLETASEIIVQDFMVGRMLSITTRIEILILIYQQGNPTVGTWQTVPGGF